VTSHQVLWCLRSGCRYPGSRLSFSLNRSTAVRLVLRIRIHNHWRTVATSLLAGDAGHNSRRLAGRWHGHLVPTRTVQLLVQITQAGKWTTYKTIRLTVRH
jgi:hypothetical protein